ncbi:biotin--[acetyl-CoA-carboxylase] ligase [Moheibacter sediminis]|uniref:BirA family transcriptional regulator, biotin operon repressor / biotin-[acetyl-CoA-carboxylase] ligase n=1 Tax=Moheibacter sediminis TaxID=1434700 RepID=A0A1W1ZAC5_9FLAO|nr:biotin--[acetyl-CoA-carboxylase] ligase [Moheibacter sediminis]SMC44908.1 BirA family transcriptional regulator, biotin operon repressor / biotin-[acetyl-CoA-carboxylase] ligase [Moheibacter sediminis]
MEIHQYDSIPSTNTVILEMSKKDAKSWTVVWTSNQTEGKGYAGNVWRTEKDKNLAVSFLINSDLNYEKLVHFNQWICNCICEFLENYSDEVCVKWPNDIIIKNKKVCGVLIETHKSENQLNIITGIGLNVNQTYFENLNKAGSLASQTDQIYDIEEILSGLLTKLESSYYLIQNKEWNLIMKTYNSKLFRKDKVSVFKKENELFNGIIQFVDESGFLHVKLENEEIKLFKNKELEMMY